MDYLMGPIFVIFLIWMLFRGHSLEHPYLHPYYTRGGKKIYAPDHWIKSNKGKMFIGYRPVAYERDIRVLESDNVPITGCTVSGGTKESKLVYIRGVSLSKQEALQALREVSKGSKANIVLENEQVIYHIREEMLEMGLFRVRGKSILLGQVELVEILNHEYFQEGDVELGLYQKHYKDKEINHES